MDLERINQLLSEAKEIYNNPRPESYTNFLKWVDSFNGDDDGKIVKGIYCFLAERNKSPCTLIFRIDDIYETEIKRYLSNSLPQ
jgi:hypothetical protein